MVNRLPYTISRIVTVIYFLLANPFFAKSQYEILNFNHLSIDNGLSDNTINAIYKDYKGYLWFGTNNGLNRFDGFNFTIFLNNSNDSNSISGNQISFILEDKQNNLWIGTRTSGLNKFDRQKQTFKRFIHNIKDTGSIVSNEVYCGIKDSSGNIWLGTLGGGLDKYDTVSNSFHHFSVVKNRKALSDSIFSIFEPQRGILLMVTSYGLDLFDTKSKKSQHKYYNRLQKGNLTDVDFKKVFCKDKSGNIWLIDNNDLFRIEMRTLDIVPMHLTNRLSMPVLTDIFENSDGKLWLGTDGGGINFYNPKTNELLVTSAIADLPASLSSNSIYKIYKDPCGIIWVGTFSGGINALDKYRNKFKVFKSYSSNKYSLNNKSVLNICNASKDKVWVATDGGGLNLFDRKTETFTNFLNEPGKPEALKKAKVIMGLSQDTKGTVWLGTYNNGLISYNPNTNAAKQYLYNSNDKNSIGANDIWAILEDSEQNLWLGTLGKGVDLFDRKTQKFIHMFRSPDGLHSISSNYISLIYEDSKKRLWIGTLNKGINVYDKQTNTIKQFLNSSDSTSISNNIIQSVIEDKQGRIWIGTINGLNLFNESNGAFTRFYEKDGLPSNSIRAIQLDNNNNFWLSTSNGISKYNLNSSEFQNYNIHDGLQSAEFHLGASTKLPDGEMYFGGLNGFNSFYPDSIQNNPFMPKVVITDLKIFNVSVNPGDKDSPLDTYIDETSSITLSYKQSVVTIEYAALNFSAPEKNQFKYKLEGFEQDWVIAKNRKTVTYTNLNPGEYTFRVIASNNDGLWNTKGASLVIYITPPYWQTLWFKSLLVLLILVAIALYTNRRLYWVRKQKEKLERVVKEKTEDLFQNNYMLKEQQEEIQRQNELLLGQSEQISLKNLELESYSIELENKVHERTKELEAALKKAQESDELKSAFLANISHEIRTPMNSIIGFSKLLVNEEFSNDERLIFINNINKGCDVLLNLINDIIDLAKIETNQMDIYIEELEFNSFFSRIYNLYKIDSPISKNENLKLSLDIPVETITVKTDPQMVEQIVKNLLGNALKFTEKGEIKMGFRVLENKVSIFVKDTGIGIPEERVADIFNNFYKIEDNKNKLFRGAGLGLALSSKLVQLLGGTLKVESTLHKGSEFTFTIPLN